MTGLKTAKYLRHGHTAVLVIQCFRIRPSDEVSDNLLAALSTKTTYDI